MGELLHEMEERGEKAKRGGVRRGSNRTPGSLKTAKSLGVGDKEAARAKRLAEPAAQDFDRAVADARGPVSGPPRGGSAPVWVR
jgi:hypothetical protein